MAELLVKAVHKDVAQDRAGSFRSFAFSKKNRFDLWSTLVLCAASYAFLLHLYPFPNTYADTGAFITVAGNWLIGNYRPIGYSLLMSLAHFITPDPDVLVLMQTLLYFFSTLVLYLTLKFFFYSGNKGYWRLFFFIFLLAPTCIYLCNFVISDALFLSLTNLWIASLLYILGTRKVVGVVVNALLLVALLNTRYIGLFYPLITVVTLFLAYYKGSKLRFLLFAALQVALFFGVIYYTKKETKENIGVEVFSAFGGWQKANNAMHMMPHIKLRPEEIADPEIRTVHAFISNHNPVSMYPNWDSVVVTYLWSAYGPLRQYLFRLQQQGKRSYLHYWHVASQPLGRWADYLIRKYPGVFIRHYIWPNFLCLFSMSNEALFYFPGPSKQMKDWFGCTNCAVQPRYNFFHNFLAATASKSFNLLWILFALSLLGLFFPKRFKLSPLQHKMLGVVSFFCILYLLMSVYASPIMLRYLLAIRHALILIPFLLFQSFLTQIKNS